MLPSRKQHSAEVCFTKKNTEGLRSDPMTSLTWKKQVCKSRTDSSALAPVAVSGHTAPTSITMALCEEVGVLDALRSEITHSRESKHTRQHVQAALTFTQKMKT